MFGGAVINDAGITGVTVVPEDQALESQLDAVGVPEFDAVGASARGADFIVNGTDRRDRAIVGQGGLDEIHFSDHPEAGGAEGDGAGVDDFQIGGVGERRGGVLGKKGIWLGEDTFSPVDPLVDG